MKLLQDLEENIILTRLRGATAEQVKNAFFANYLAALILLKLQDLKGLMLINDHRSVMLTKFTNTMSDVNYWGRAMFFPSEHEVRDLLGEIEAELLRAHAKRVTLSRVQRIMRVPLTSPDAIDWDETLAAILLLATVFNLRSSYFISITRALHRWDVLNPGAQQKAVSDVLMFLMQSDPQSRVILHLRNLSNVIMTRKLSSVHQRFVGFMKITETDGGGATSAASVGTTSNAIISPSSGSNAGTSQQGYSSTAQDMQTTLGGLYKLVKLSSNQVTKKGRFTIRNGKLVKRKVKDFAPKKFTAPDFMKVKKEKEDGTK